MTASSQAGAGWRRTIEQQRTGGLSIAALCRRNRVPASSFFGWRRKPRGEGTFVEVKQSEEPMAVAAGIELRLAGGRRVRVRPSSRSGAEAPGPRQRAKEQSAKGYRESTTTRNPILQLRMSGGHQRRPAVEPRDVQWLWFGRVPLGRITLLVGRPGEGKSFLTTDMAARVTTGAPWPDGSPCPSGSVILVSAEDDPADTIRPRLDAHGANVRRVYQLSVVRHVNDDGKTDEVMFKLEDVAALEAALQAQPNCKLIVVDPIGSFLGSRINGDKDNEVRGVLAPVARLAEKYGPAVLVVMHYRKSAARFADDLALGSRAFTGIARVVWHLTRDSADKGRRLLLPGKNNLAPEGGRSSRSVTSRAPTVNNRQSPGRCIRNDARPKPS